MPHYLVQIFKTHNFEPRPWSNVYQIDAASLVVATNAADMIATAERGFHKVSVTFLYARISTTTEGDDEYTTLPINLPGVIADPADALPLWNTLRADINVVGGGRPSRKFYRLPLGEAETNGMAILVGQRNQVITALTQLNSDLAALSVFLEDPQAQRWSVDTVLERIQMRQLHRRRRRIISTPSP